MALIGLTFQTFALDIRTLLPSVRPRRVPNACARGTRTPSTRAARARALFLKNAVLHASTRAHACARAISKIIIFFLIFFQVPDLFDYKTSLNFRLPSDEKVSFLQKVHPS